jgi:hypothetical protein
MTLLSVDDSRAARHVHRPLRAVYSYQEDFRMQAGAVVVFHTTFSPLPRTPFHCSMQPQGFSEDVEQPSAWDASKKIRQNM